MQSKGRFERTTTARHTHHVSGETGCDGGRGGGGSGRVFLTKWTGFRERFHREKAL
jgi:hypothetical protein